MTNVKNLGIVPIMPHSGKWKTRAGSCPHVTVSGFAVDKDGRFPMLYRGPNVRSAKNCWSLPSGLHEVGYSMEQQFAIELQQECNLEAVVDTARMITVYENIAAVDSWHWVICIMVMGVKSLDTFINKEPDKHPETKFATVNDLQDIKDWAPGLKGAVLANMNRIEETIQYVSRLMRPFKP